MEEQIAEKEKIIERKLFGTMLNTDFQDRMKIVCIKTPGNKKLYEIYEEAIEAYLLIKESELAG